MPWVKFDDQYPQHPKIGPMTDRRYRLANEAVFWCARNLTDGHIGREHLTQIRPNARPADAADLVARRIWHATDDPPCDGEKCPHDGTAVDGWVVHDYWDFQPSKTEVVAERKARAERQKRWRDKRRNGNASTPAQSNGNVDALPTPDETRHRRVSDGDSNGDSNPPVDAAPYPPPARPARGGDGAPPRDAAPPGGAPNRPPPASSAGGAGGGRNPDHLARQAAIAACQLCDHRGYLPSGRICMHDPHRIDATTRGAAAARAALQRDDTEGTANA